MPHRIAVVLLALLCSTAGCRNADKTEDDSSERRIARQFGPDADNDGEEARRDYRDSLRKRIKIREKMLKYEAAVEHARADLKIAQRRMGLAQERMRVEGKEVDEDTWFPGKEQRQLRSAERALEKARDRLDKAEGKLTKARRRLEE